MARILVNASPLIFLVKAGLLDILRKLFDEVYTTSAVIDEIRVPLSRGIVSPDIEAIFQADWIKVLQLTGKERAEAEAWADELGIDIGEAGVAVLFKRGGFDAMVVGDEVAEARLKQKEVNTRDITEIGLLAAYKRLYDLKEFARAVFDAGYRTRRVRALLG
ncbi:MAG: hypothetical protein HY619_02145 [Thaumarchaeota archaeon]|nr:hypothetical protein [Nitrososphaerota archaeon]